MSCYITIKKKGVTLCCYNRNTEFYKALSGEKGSYVTFEDAVHVMKVLFAFYESGKNNSKKIFIEDIN